MGSGGGDYHKRAREVLRGRQGGHSEIPARDARVAVELTRRLHSGGVINLEDSVFVRIAEPMGVRFWLRTREVGESRKLHNREIPLGADAKQARRMVRTMVRRARWERVRENAPTVAEVAETADKILGLTRTVRGIVRSIRGIARLLGR